MLLHTSESLYFFPDLARDVLEEGAENKQRIMRTLSVKASDVFVAYDRWIFLLLQG